MIGKNEEPKTAWVNIVDHLADSVIEETLDELAADLRPGQSVATSAASIRNKLLDAFDGDDREAFERENPATVSGTEISSLVLLIRRRSGRQLTEVAKEIPNASLEFLTLVSRFPDLTPHQVKSKISEELESRFSIPSAESQLTLKRRPPIAMAASSARAPEPDPTDFQELLSKSNLTAKQRSFWRSLE